jgi:protein translocase SecG subunit
MSIFITILHIVVCIVLVLVVLLQAGKGAAMGAAFGGSSQTVFGSSGPGTFLSKMTTLMDKAVPQTQEQTATPAAAPAAGTGEQKPQTVPQK